jgi:hypothetical protein
MGGLGAAGHFARSSPGRGFFVMLSRKAAEALQR